MDWNAIIAFTIVTGLAQQRRVSLADIDRIGQMILFYGRGGEAKDLFYDGIGTDGGGLYFYNGDDFYGWAEKICGTEDLTL